VLVERVWSVKTQPEEADKSHTRYFISSLDTDQGPHAAKAIRGHWMVENANHYRRDTCQWREDDHRHRRINIAQNLALTRNALLTIIPFDADRNLRSLLDEYHRNPRAAIQLLLHARPV
jgi:hypothetical protein